MTDIIDVDMDVGIYGTEDKVVIAVRFSLEDGGTAHGFCARITAVVVTTANM